MIKISAYQGSQQSPTITRLDPCFRIRFETTTSAQARTNRKQRNIGNLAKGACGPCTRPAGSAYESDHARQAAGRWLCKYPATATPSIAMADVGDHDYQWHKTRRSMQVVNDAAKSVEIPCRVPGIWCAVLLIA
eukprot:g57671.t1